MPLLLSKQTCFLQFGSGLGQKNSKGTVSIINADGRIRLRWRYQNKRASVNLSSYSKTNLLQAKKIQKI